MKRSEETRKKISNTIRDKYQTDEAYRNKLQNSYKKGSERNKKISLKLTGRHLSLEHRKKISLAKKGTHHSEETKRKMSFTRKGHRYYGGMLGKHHSNESRKKISLSKIGKPRDKETKEKLRTRALKYYETHDSPRKGIHLKPETIQKILNKICKTPNSYESKVIYLIEHYPKIVPFKYIGDGKDPDSIVGHVCPDFIDTLGLDPPLIIETYTEWCHPDNYEENRYKELCIPKQNVLFLSDEDLDRKDWKFQCLEKIRFFMLDRESL